MDKNVTPKQTILVADDEELTRHLLAATLDGQGFNVLVAEDGTKALSLLSAHEVALIISDIHMPKMGGLRLMEELQKSAHKAIPIILITADSDSFALQSAKGAKIIRKPFRRRELVELINSVLARESA